MDIAAPADAIAGAAAEFMPLLPAVTDMGLEARLRRIITEQLVDAGLRKPIETFEEHGSGI